MRLTTYTDYSLRLLIYLAMPGRQTASVREVADAFGISRYHLVKVAQQLAKEGYVETIRGRSGGVMLAQAPHDIVVGDIVRRMEEDMRIVECFGNSTRCVINPACRLKGILAEAVNAFLATLDSYTLDDLANPDLAGLFLQVTPVPSRKEIVHDA
jgi:Rrf2 family nitric oxide-sensitive transcriptional repressor